MSDDAETEVRRPEETPTLVVDSEPRSALQLTPGAILGGRYRIVSLIGSGGMGAVYRADDLKLGQTVALKFLANHIAAARLLDEVRIGRQVSHPNVCRLYDVVEVDGQSFITMEFVDGEDLASLLRRVGRLPSEKALAVARDICAGVAAAHEKNVVHRDLKPANVMIDGRGRGRVTDFGLAVAGAHASDNAGTPAYMAPEQLAGEPASTASDIYALGLVLYEIFTGRRPFTSSSTHDLMMRQRARDYTRPSVVTNEVPAAVERTIVRCLDPEPSERPASVAEIIRDLPGRDALSLAVAAGETPSPAMVAAASKSGDISPALAWTLLAVTIAGFIANAAIGDRNRIRVKAPEVLQERAREILADAGASARRDSDLLLNEQSGSVVAIYRQSGSAMVPRNADGILRANDPPLEPGMSSVMLDANGALLAFTIVPPVVDRSTARDVPQWDRFIRDAGYDPAMLRAATPERTAPVDTDSKFAWLAKDGRRIEAAAFHGRPVWFSAKTLERRGDFSPRGTPADRLAFAMFAAFMIGIPIAGLFLARANIRKKQIDRAGAARAAVTFGVAMLLALMFHAHHPMTFVDEWIMTSWHVAQATFWALITAVFYVALEPLVRKRWPQILIAWTRLIAGRFSDAMVGRDVLMGAAASVIAVLVWHSTYAVTQTALVGWVSGIGPARWVVFLVGRTFCEALFRGFGMILLLLLMRAFVRHDLLASLITMLLIAASALGDAPGPLGIRLFYAVAASLAGIVLARQCGMLAVMAYAFFLVIQQRMPFTLDPDAWYFGRSAVVLALLLLVVVYAFRVSMGAKRWLPRLAFEV